MVSYDLRLFAERLEKVENLIISLMRMKKDVELLETRIVKIEYQLGNNVYEPFRQFMNKELPQIKAAIEQLLDERKVCHK